MMHRMTDCTATSVITLNGHPIKVICNLKPHDDGQHRDVVHGDWTEEGRQ
jgi:hypothetical protein